MVKGLLRVVAIAGVAAGIACVRQTELPPVSGLSTFARSVTMRAIPDRISQDGVSQSSVEVQVIGPDGRPLSGVPVRVDMVFGGVVADFGSLSPRSIVTGTDGIARAVYTAPLPSPGPNTPVLTVSIRAIPIGTDAQTSLSTTVDIRLMPQGVILPPASTPTPAFTITPTPVNMNIASTFDASTSCAGPAPCIPGGALITSFSWNFGDNTPLATGMIVQHTFTSTGSFSVTLTVTNDRGVAASTTQTLLVGTSPAPSGDWVFSPTNPTVNSPVIFNADGVKPSPGRRIVQYSWDFGDGSTDSGFLVTHRFAIAQIYTVVLTVRDDADQKTTISKPVTISTGNPVPVITFSPTAPRVADTVAFDSSGSTMSGGATPQAWLWSFGDPASGANNTSALQNPTHKFSAAGTYTVRLTITDSQNRSGTATVAVTVNP